MSAKQESTTAPNVVRIQLEAMSVLVRMEINYIQMEEIVKVS